MKSDYNEISTSENLIMVDKSLSSDKKTKIILLLLQLLCGDPMRLSCIRKSDKTWIESDGGRGLCRTEREGSG